MSKQKQMGGSKKVTTNKYWIFLEKLRRSGKVNMYGATPFLQEEFGISNGDARIVLADWMRNYNREDYEGME